MTNDLKLAIKNRNVIQKELKNNRQDLTLQNNYKNEKKKVKSMIQRTKINYFKEQFQNCKGDSSKTWNTIKTLIPNKNNSSKSFEFEETMEKAEEFNHFFAEVGKKAYDKTQENLNDENEAIIKTNTINSQIKFRPEPVNVETVILTVKDLNETKACGCDGIAFRFIKDALPVIVFLFNCHTKYFNRHW